MVSIYFSYDVVLFLFDYLSSDCLSTNIASKLELPANCVVRKYSAFLTCLIYCSHTTLIQMKVR